MSVTRASVKRAWRACLQPPATAPQPSRTHLLPLFGARGRGSPWAAAPRGFSPCRGPDVVLASVASGRPADGAGQWCVPCSTHTSVPLLCERTDTVRLGGGEAGAQCHVHVLESESRSWRAQHDRRPAPRPDDQDRAPAKRPARLRRRRFLPWSVSLTPLPTPGRRRAVILFSIHLLRDSDAAGPAVVCCCCVNTRESVGQVRGSLGAAASQCRSDAQSFHVRSSGRLDVESVCAEKVLSEARCYEAIASRQVQRPRPRGRGRWTCLPAEPGGRDSVSARWGGRG